MPAVLQAMKININPTAAYILSVYVGINPVCCLCRAQAYHSRRNHLADQKKNCSIEAINTANNAITRASGSG